MVRTIIVLVLILFFIFLAISVYLALRPLVRERKVRSSFPRDYVTARKDFLERANKHKGDLTAYEIKARGPNDETLTIDTAWYGSETPKTVLLHISGTHGVEGFAGSAIQGALLEEEIVLPEDMAVVFLHGLNPYGMAHLRRVNESNVDLNRNFLLKGDTFSGSPDGYQKIESFLNPQRTPRLFSLFLPKTLYQILNYGFAPLKQAIAGGQYDYPKGIYYGGARREESLHYLHDWIEKSFKGVEKLYAIEVHTGLGDYAKDILFWPFAKDDPRTRTLEKSLNETLDSDDPEDGSGFKTPGDLQNAVPQILPDTEVSWILQEFGTYHPIRVLWSLRDENAYHHYDVGDVTHWSKTNLLNAFVPDDEEWERAIVARGRELFHKLLTHMAADQAP